MTSLTTEIRLADYIPSEAWRHNPITGVAVNDGAVANDPTVTGDIAPFFNLALRDMCGKIDWKIQATVQRLILPPGNWRCDTPINWALLDNRRINLAVEGAGPNFNNPYGGDSDNATTLFFTGGGFQFDFNGRFGCLIRGMSLAGQRKAPTLTAGAWSMPNPLPLAMILLRNQNGGGNSQHRIEDVSIWDGVAGIQIACPVPDGQHGEPSGDSMEFTRVTGQRCGRFIRACTEQSVFDSFTRMEAIDCPTVVAWDAGGSSVSEWSLSKCGDACPSIPARPVPNKDTDWVFTFGQPGSIQDGPGAPIHRIAVSDCEGGTGQFVNVLGDWKKINLMLNSAAPGSNSPIYHLRGANSSLKIHDSNIVILGEQPFFGIAENGSIVTVVDTDLVGRPGPVVGNRQWVRSRSLQPAGWVEL